MKNNHFINMCNFRNDHNLQKKKSLTIQDWPKKKFAHSMPLNVRKY